MDNLGPGCLSTERSKEAFISTLGIENNKSYNQKKNFSFFLFSLIYSHHDELTFQSRDFKTCLAEKNPVADLLYARTQVRIWKKTCQYRQGKRKQTRKQNLAKKPSPLIMMSWSDRSQEQRYPYINFFKVAKDNQILRTYKVDNCMIFTNCSVQNR